MVGTPAGILVEGILVGEATMGETVVAGMAIPIATVLPLEATAVVLEMAAQAPKAVLQVIFDSLMGQSFLTMLTIT